MIRTSLRLIFCLALPLVLSACDSVDQMGSTLGVSDWFNSPSKSDLKGERISVMSMDSSVQPDPELAKTQVLLPRPYINRDWPEPGGYATNAMYHLAATG